MIKITKEQAKVIEITNDRSKIVEFRAKGTIGGTFKSLDELTLDELIRALYVGYDIEEKFKVGDWINYVNGQGDRKTDRIVWEEGDELFLPGGRKTLIMDAYHATEAEVKNEKRRRWWASHDREVGEVKERDLEIDETDIKQMDQYVTFKGGKGMDDKERLEEIRQINVFNSSNLRSEDIDWLIEQAERIEEIDESIDDVQKYLQANQIVNDDVSYRGKNVIGVLLDVSKEREKIFEYHRNEINRVSGQAMRFQDEKSTLEGMLRFSERERVELIEKNRRHREAIKKAHKLNHDEHFNYDVDRILLRALEEK